MNNLFLEQWSIVIVNYNLRDDTVNCIESLLRAGAQEHQITVVDNNSSDDSVNFIRQNFTSVNLIEMPENRGYPHALNSGIIFSLKKPIQWILLLNNDIIVDKEFLIELGKATDKKDFSLFSPAIYYYNEPDRIWYLGEKVIKGTLIGFRYYRNRKVKKKLPPLIPSDFLNGCAMLINRKVFEEIGIFDDTEFIYGDDPDFSWRAKSKGFSAAAVPSAKMWHKVSKTMNKTKPSTYYLKIKNTIRFYKKHSKGLTRAIMFFYTFIRIFTLSIYNTFTSRIALVRPAWRGWFNGWFYKNTE